MYKHHQKYIETKTFLQKQSPLDSNHKTTVNPLIFQVNFVF